MAYKYSSVICAGTFEHVHEGHKAFLRFAFSLAEKVYITITSDAYTAIYKPYAAPFAQRVSGLEHFLKEEGVLFKARIVQIDDVYGIALDKNLEVQALVVTEETMSGAQKVNEKRVSLGLLPLAVEVCPLRVGQTGLAISSTYLRTGMFAANGDLVVKNEFMKADLLLPQILRHKLQKPFGRFATEQVISQLNPQKTIAVGDVTTRVLHGKGIKQVLSLVDFVVQREKQDTSLASIGFDGTEKVLHVKNPPGMITPQLWVRVEEALQLGKTGEQVVLIVDGEEDLAVLPLLLEVSFGYTICYGQPNEGMVAIEVTKETKQFGVTILSHFSRHTTRGY